MTLIKFNVLDEKRIKRRLNKDFSRMFDKNMDKSGTVLLNATKAVVPKKTGALSGSLKKVRLGSGSYGVTSGKFYGGILINGAPPHKIFPVNKLALSWPGINHPVSMVNHPGIKPNPFPKKAREKAQPEIRRLLKQFGKEVIE